MNKRNNTLQSMCCDYLSKLRYMGKKHGIDVDAIIEMNQRGECFATDKEVELLSRACDDERVFKSRYSKDSWQILQAILRRW